MKIGDKVTVSDKIDPSYLRGRTGTVTAVNDAGWDVTVKFPEPLINDYNPSNEYGFNLIELRPVE